MDIAGQSRSKSDGQLALEEFNRRISVGCET